jgi:hypothetical protein
VDGSGCSGDRLADGVTGDFGDGSTGGTAIRFAGAGGGGYFGGASGGEPADMASTQGDIAGSAGGGGGGASFTGGAGVSNATVTDTGNSGQVKGQRRGRRR